MAGMIIPRVTGFPFHPAADLRQDTNRSSGGL